MNATTEKDEQSLSLGVNAASDHNASVHGP